MSSERRLISVRNKPWFFILGLILEIRFQKLHILKVNLWFHLVLCIKVNKKRQTDKSFYLYIKKSASLRRQETYLLQSCIFFVLYVSFLVMLVNRSAISNTSWQICGKNLQIEKNFESYRQTFPYASLKLLECSFPITPGLNL